MVKDISTILQRKQKFLTKAIEYYQKNDIKKFEKYINLEAAESEHLIKKAKRWLLILMIRLKLFIAV